MYTYTHTPVRRQNLNHTYSWYGASAKGPGTAADVVLGISAGKYFMYPEVQLETRDGKVGRQCALDLKSTDDEK